MVFRCHPGEHWDVHGSQLSFLPQDADTFAEVLFKLARPADALANDAEGLAVHPRMGLITGGIFFLRGRIKRWLDTTQCFGLPANVGPIAYRLTSSRLLQAS